MIKCPKCGLCTSTYQKEIFPGLFGTEDYPLYERGQKGEPEYISPRCSRCYDKKINNERSTT